MIYYRLAVQKNRATEWEWQTECVNSLEELLHLGRQDHSLSAEQLRVFMASSHAYLDILLVRENMGLSSNSLTLEQLLHGSHDLTLPRIQSFEQELGWREGAEITPAAQPIQVADAPGAIEYDYEPGGGDHDQPYSFAFPVKLPQARAWIKLRERVLAGELVS